MKRHHGKHASHAHGMKKRLPRHVPIHHHDKAAHHTHAAHNKAHGTPGGFAPKHEEYHEGPKSGPGMGCNETHC